MNVSNVLSIFDPYERKARAFPALLVVLPILVPLLLTLGPKNPVLTAVLGLVSSCGVVYAIASIARGLGKRLERKLVAKWGGMPTTLILRHRDPFLDRVSKQRYHSEIKSKLGVELPSPEQEAADTAAADDAYLGATRQLRELTRGKSNALLLTENIAYGFHRNMRAVRPIGTFSSLVGLILGLFLSGAFRLTTSGLEFVGIDQLRVTGIITFGLSLALFFAWFYFTTDAVKQMGYVYAERLFESLKALPKLTKTRAKKPAD